MAFVKQLTSADVAGGLELSSASGWNQTAEDWERALTLPGTRGWGIEAEGRIVSTTTAIRYGDFAWIGMVLTAESHRGQGLAGRLLTEALQWLDDCACVKLDATAMGAPLYQRFGFEDEGEVTRYVGRPPGDATVTLGGVRGPDAFEADRTELLTALGPPACLADGSFAFGRAGRHSPFFGPCVAEDGEPLLRWFATQVSEPFFVDRMGAAPAGFAPARTLMRMYRGQPKPTSPRQYAFAGFEFG